MWIGWRIVEGTCKVACALFVIAMLQPAIAREVIAQDTLDLGTVSSYINVYGDSMDTQWHYQLPLRISAANGVTILGYAARNLDRSTLSMISVQGPHFTGAPDISNDKYLHVENGETLNVGLEVTAHGLRQAAAWVTVFYVGSAGLLDSSVTFVHARVQLTNKLLLPGFRSSTMTVAACNPNFPFDFVGGGVSLYNASQTDITIDSFRVVGDTSDIVQPDATRGQITIYGRGTQYPPVLVPGQSRPATIAMGLRPRGVGHKHARVRIWYTTENGTSDTIGCEIVCDARAFDEVIARTDRGFISPMMKDCPVDSCVNQFGNPATFYYVQGREGCSAKSTIRLTVQGPRSAAYAIVSPGSEFTVDSAGPVSVVLKYCPTEPGYNPANGGYVYDTLVVAAESAAGRRDTLRGLISSRTVPSGVNENPLSPNENLLSVYPNPFHDELAIEIGTVTHSRQLIIADAIGRIVSTRRLSPGETMVHWQPSASLTNGAYLLRVGDQTRIVALWH